MLGISYGELFLIIGATAALIVVIRVQGFANNCANHREISWKGNWICPSGPCIKNYKTLFPNLKPFVMRFELYLLWPRGQCCEYISYQWYNFFF
ncbi:unnamed protein product [Coffea canephora]|uniref:Uncharacterized protein n=1 Tax=Coffea canephora TaxID=49390 RepID=A0A068URE5_COFCA|nr:unnamed protein product [Coffea canephora]